MHFRFIGKKYVKVLKWLALIALPAIGAFYMAFAAIWDLPYSTEVGKTCTALALFFGVLIGLDKPKEEEDGND